MDKRFLIVAGVILVAIAAVGLYLHEDSKTVDAELESWDLYEENDGSLMVIRNGGMSILPSLDDAEKGDKILIGKAWSDANLDQSVKDRINSLAEYGVLIMTLGNNLEPFETFMGKYSYDFEEDAYAYSIHMLGGMPCTSSMTVPTERELTTWLGYWETPAIIHHFTDRTVDWKYCINSFSVRYLWEDSYVMKSRQFLTDPEDPDYILSVEEYQSVTNDRQKGTDNSLRSVRQEVVVGNPGKDSILEFAPTVDTYNKSESVMRSHGNVQTQTPGVCSSFVQTNYLDQSFSVEFNIKDDLAGSTITLYPAYMAKASGEYTAHTDMSVVVDRGDMKWNQRYSVGYDTCLRERV